MPPDGELLTEYIPQTKTFRHSWRERTFRRQIEINGQSKEYLRFALLPNVNGQRYTLGTSFASREEQGEFIFISHNEKELSQKSLTGCQIIVQENKFWLNAASKDPPIFINGNEVRSKTELQFGDNLTILGCNTPTTLLFMERPLDPEAFTHPTAGWDIAKPDEIESRQSFQDIQENMEFIPGQNSLILSQIFSFLPISQLRSCRLVSQLWSEEGFKQLRKRATLDLDASRGEIHTHSDNSLPLFRYWVEMRANPIQNWKLELPPLPVDDPDEAGELNGMDVKLLEDLSRYIFDSKKPLIVKKLKLGGNMLFRYDYEIRLKLFQTLQTHLQELEWEGEWQLHENNSGQGHTFPGRITFPKLRMFNFAIEVKKEPPTPEGSLEDCAKFTWLAGLIRAISGVTVIELGCESPLTTVFFRHFNQSGSHSFPNLNRICVLNPDGDVMRIMSKCPVSFKDLEIGQFLVMTENDCNAFVEVLDKFCQTLESFKFAIAPETGSPGDKEINIPIFTNLTNLNISWERCNDVKLVFSGGRINYKEHFPRLKCLTLKPMKLYEAQPYNKTSVPRVRKDSIACYAVFFPGLVQDSGDIKVVGSVQVLRILTRVKMECGGSNPLFSKRQVAIISKMFPNLKNKAWEKIALKESTVKSKNVLSKNILPEEKGSGT